MQVCCSTVHHLSAKVLVYYMLGFRPSRQWIVKMNFVHCDSSSNYCEHVRVSTLACAAFLHISAFHTLFHGTKIQGLFNMPIVWLIYCFKNRFQKLYKIDKHHELLSS